MIIETCPICGGDLMPYVITTYPPIAAKKCLKCAFIWEGKQDEIIRIKFDPTVDVEERKTGKWVLKTFDDGYGEYQLYECDKCRAVRAHRTNYCHNCGAKMESEE